MARIHEQSLTPSGETILTISVDETGKTANQVETEVQAAIDAKYPPAAGWVCNTTTVTACCRLAWGNRFIRSMLALVTDVSERILENGDVVIVTTLSQP